MRLNRRLALLGALACPLLRAEPARMGLHGMALFGGREGLYASHLPMFHAPHDVQLLLRIRLQDVAIDQQLRKQLGSQPKLWTLEPEHFDLSRLHAGHPQPLLQFGARLVEGHFEREGQTRAESVTVQIEQLLLFNRLLPAQRQAPQQRFLWFGRGREQFLVKYLEQRPDIDLIGRFVNRQPLHGQRLLSLPAAPLAAPEGIDAALRHQGARPLGAVQWVYAETGDLV